MAYKRTTDPTTEPVTLAEAKAQCRITTDTDDAYLNSLIKAARERTEGFLNRGLINGTWTLVRSGFPPDGCNLLLPVNPVASITSISYVDTNGDSQTWDVSLYSLDASGEQGQIVPAYQQAYPSTRDIPTAVTVVFVAGYGANADSVPETFKLAMKLMISHWYWNRGALGEIPDAAKNLLFPQRLSI